MSKLKKLHNFLIDRNRLGLELNWITKLWYIVLLITFSIIVICNFCDIMTTSIFKEIDGLSIVFIFWLFLLILPLFESFEGFGVRMKRNNDEDSLLTEKITQMTDSIIDKKIQQMNEKEIEDILNRDDF